MSCLMTGKVRVLGCLGGETGGREGKKQHTDRYVLCRERGENERRSGGKGKGKGE